MNEPNKKLIEDLIEVEITKYELVIERNEAAFEDYNQAKTELKRYQDLLKEINNL